MFKFDIKTHLYIRFIDKERIFNAEECSQKDGRPYAIVLTATDNHSLIIVDAVLLTNKSEILFGDASP